MHPLTKRFKLAWQQSYVITPTERLILAVSGGQDSMGLLHLCVASGVHAPERLQVVHVRHGLRADDDREAQLVVAVAKSLGVVSDVVRLAPPPQGGEAGARRARYAALAACASRWGAKVVLTAHHADDQAETVLLNLLRGSGLDGLQGMRSLSGWPFPAVDAPRLYRPLLAFSKAEIAEYVAAQEIPFREDPTNQDITLRRNWVRHTLLPLLRTQNPQIAASLTRLATAVQGDLPRLAAATHQLWEQLLLDQGTGWVRLALSGWRSSLLGEQRALLRHAYATLHGSRDDLTFEAVEAARLIGLTGEVGAQADLASGVRLVVGYTDLLVQTATAVAPLPNLPQLTSPDPQPIPVPGQLQLTNGWLLSAEIVPPPSEPSVDSWTVELDAAAVQGSLHVRPRQPGERFQPLGLAGHSRKIKKMMIDARLPQPLRTRWPLVADEAGPLWLAGLHLAERGRISGATDRCLRLKLRHIPG